MRGTADLVSVGECGFCGYIKYQGLFHTCSTAPKFKATQSNCFRVETSELSPEEENNFYKKVFGAREEG